MKSLFLILCFVCFALSLAPGLKVQGTYLNARAAAQRNSDTKIEVKTSYDEEKGESTIEFRKMPIATTQAKKVFLNVSATFPGRKLNKQPDDVILIVQVISERRTFPDALAMRVQADGKKLPDLLMLNLDKRELDGDYLETIATRMKFEEFAKISRAKVVSLQLNDLKLDLHEAEIALFSKLELLLETAPTGQAFLNPKPQVPEFQVERWIKTRKDSSPC